MGQRIRTALIAIPIALALIKWGGLPFSSGVMILALVAWREYRNMFRQLDYVLFDRTVVPAIVIIIALAAWIHDIILLVGLFVPFIVLFSLSIMLEGLYRHAKGHWPENTALSCMALLYIALPFAHFILLRQMMTSPTYLVPVWGSVSLGEALLWTVMFGTWASDTFAYFGGRFMGKTPLAPTVSPHKTREGAICGAIGTVLVICLMGCRWLNFSFIKVLGLAVLVAIFAPLGDLVESVMKRSCGIKDSGNFFPGHGGVLDRCDSLIFSVPIAYYYISFVLL
jgi:phosphatidate cytidylyltransferase